MAAAPGTKCPACGMVRDPPAAKPLAEKTAPAPESRPRHAPERPRPATGPRGGAPPGLASLPIPNAIDRVAVGATLLIWAAIALFASMVFSQVSEIFSEVLRIAGFLLGMAAVLLVGNGLGMAKGTLLFVVILMLVPAVNFVVALLMVARAAAALKAAGRRVSFPGVKLGR
jgi:hypothetical protein